jgi:hypothetical protein
MRRVLKGAMLVRERESLWYSIEGTLNLPAIIFLFRGVLPFGSHRIDYLQ